MLNTQIFTNPTTDYMMGRNGSSKLKAIAVWNSNEMVFVDGINSKGTRICNSGLRFARDPSVLRELSIAFATMADDAEKSCTLKPNLVE